MVSAKYGMQQDALETAQAGPDALAAWAGEVAREWRWLFANADVTTLTGEAFDETVLGSPDFWLVLFVDGEDCGPCRVALTNLVRLSAGVRGLARVGVVDCELEVDAPGGGVCARVGVPPAPHAPVIRVFRRGVKGPRYAGEDLFNAMDVEPHVALQLSERLLRLALAMDLVGESAVSLGEGPEWTGEPTPTPTPPPPPPPPRPLWNGPPRPRSIGDRPASGAPAVPMVRG